MLEVTRKDGVIYLKGVIHERGELLSLITDKPPLSINLKEISGINSQGVLGFVEFVRHLGDAEVVFMQCSTPVVDAMCIVPAMLGTPAKLTRLRSFYVDFKCADCDDEFEVLVDVRNVPKAPKELGSTTCPKCGADAYAINEPESIFMYLYPEAP